MYALVRDTRHDVLREVGEVKTDLASVSAKVDQHLLEHAVSKGGKDARDRIAGLAKTTWAVLLSTAAVLISAFNVFAKN